MDVTLAEAEPTSGNILWRTQPSLSTIGALCG